MVREVPKGAYRITLLNPTTTADGVFSHEKEGLTGVARFHPSSYCGDVKTSLLTHNLSIGAVDGVHKV